VHPSSCLTYPKTISLANHLGDMLTLTGRNHL
jgi:hypothetical protein